MIRPMRADDSEAVGMLWHELVAYHQALDISLPAPAPDGVKRYIQRINGQRSDSHTRVFVAEVDGEVVGYVLGVLIDLLPEMFVQERAGYVADLYVRPAYRGHGIGRGLVRAITQWLKSIGVSHFEWYVASRNLDGIAFWRAIGGSDVMIRMRAPINDDD